MFFPVTMSPLSLPALLTVCLILGVGTPDAFSQIPPAAPATVAPVANANILRRANEVARYPEIDPELQPPVQLDATVTFVDPGGTVFLQDESGATFIRNSKSGRSMRPGMRLRVKGTRVPGLYIGGIAPESVEILGEGPLPSPVKVTPDDLVDGRYHYQLVELDGVGRSMELTGENTASLRLNTRDGVAEVRFDQNPPEDTHDFVDAQLKVTGLAAGAINDRRQLVHPYVRVADIRAITISAPPPPDPFDLPPVSVAALLAAANRNPDIHRVKVKGTALSGVLGGGFYLREGTRSLFVHTPYAEPLEPGDDVEALGFPQMGNFSAMLADAVFRVTARGTTPAPVAVTAKELANGSCDSELVVVNAKILQRSGTANVWVAEVESTSFKVIGPASPAMMFEPGSRVQFTGLCRVSSTRSEGYRTFPTSYDLWLRQPEDALLLTAPSWWNARRLALALAGVAGAGVLVAAWAGLLKLQVNRQLGLLQLKTQQEAVLEERQRIAREFHDTLEQELAGLSLRLDAATPRVADDKARQLLEQQRKLLSRLQTETRDFVWDLRDASRNEVPLPEALQGLVDHLQTTTAIPIQVEVHGEIPPLPPLVQHHLLRIAREAVNNALKYALPQKVIVKVETDAQVLRLTVADDGKGFDPSKMSVSGGHFGLQGMRERSRKLHTELSLQSTPGGGTSVGLTLALPALRASFT